MAPELIFGAACFFIAGAGFFLLNMYANSLKRRIADAQAWPRVRGTVTASRVHSSKNSYTPVIRYEYEVQGRKLKGGRIQFGGWLGTKVETDALVQAHPVGAACEIIHDPVRPTFAVLLAKGSPSNYRWAGIWIAAAFVATGIALMWLGGKPA